MRIAIIWLTLFLSVLSASPNKSETVTKEDAIGAFREYRTGVKLISAIYNELMDFTLTESPAGEVEIPKEKIKDYKRARKHLENSIALNPYFPEVYVFLANSYWELENDLQMTIEFYGKALEIDPDYDDVISARAQVFIILKQVEDAEKDLRRLDALDSEYAAPLREQIEEIKREANKTQHHKSDRAGGS